MRFVIIRKRQNQADEIQLIADNTEDRRVLRNLQGNILKVWQFDSRHPEQMTFKVIPEERGE